MGWWSDLTGATASDAANRAAADTYAKQQAAVRGLNAYADTVPSSFNAVASGYDPYVSAGGSALTRLMAGLGLGGDTAEFTSAYRSLPGYEAGREAGLSATQGALNAGNMGQSGRALKALYRFGSDYEDQRSGNYLDRLAGLQAQGLSATGARAGIQGQGLTTQAGLRQSAFGGDMSSAGTVGQGMVAGAQARQTALTNLMGAGTYLAGSALGGGWGGGLGGASSGLNNLFRFGSLAGSGFNGSGFPRG